MLTYVCVGIICMSVEATLNRERTLESLQVRLGKCNITEAELMAILYSLQICKDAIKSGDFDAKAYGTKPRDLIEQVIL